MPCVCVLAGEAPPEDCTEALQPEHERKAACGVPEEPSQEGGATTEAEAGTGNTITVTLQQCTHYCVTL